MSRSRTLHLIASRRTLPSRRISATPSVSRNSANWLRGMRSPLGALIARLRSAAIGSPCCAMRTVTSNRRSPSNIWVTTRPLVAASIASWMSCTLMPYLAAAARSTTICSCGNPAR